MTADELFLLTFEDLEERVTLGRGEYDALMSAWLLRKLLLDEQPLVHRANRSRRFKLKFRMYDDQPPEGIEGWGPGYFLWPDPENQSGRPIVELTLDLIFPSEVAADLLAKPTVTDAKRCQLRKPRSCSGANRRFPLAVLRAAPIA